ncbi:MAG: glycoside hydrolase family 15 protein [Candidatus Omnitrophica bacterium]|nr:glycoside hydrolase family 15 protein [Candidatus Omnitrophota bacterium]
MPRDIPVGNGSLLIAFDRDYLIRDIYFPHVGLENHSAGHPFRFGIWVDGQFSEMGPEWQKTLRYLEDTVVTEVTATHDRLQLELTCQDAVDFHLNIYVKEIVVKNLANAPREARLFFSHDFHISGTEVGDTANYDPRNQALIHYKGKRYFLMNCCDPTKCGVAHFACGLKETQGLEGTWKDAEDGVLSGNAIAQGSVDSTAGITIRLPANGTATAYYWMCAGTTYQEVAQLNPVIREKTPAELLKRTANYWRLWVTKELRKGCDQLPPKVLRLLTQSLLILRTQLDNDGAILAANDTDIFAFSRDTYSYMWPRDGAFVASALIHAGYSEASRRFFNFCHSIIEPDGYFLHKYSPDGSVGSSWHPWWRDGHHELPIQEDETALVLCALWQHFERFHDVEFIKPLYRDLIIKPAEFMVRFRDDQTKLPQTSYDLWEERRGVHTFTTSTVVAGLRAAAHFAQAFGEHDLATKYRATAQEMAQAMRQHLFHHDLNRFAKCASPKPSGGYDLDMTIDASLFALWYFKVFEPLDPMVVSTMQAVYDRLWVKTAVGGLARYERDAYHQVEHNDVEHVPGNPWFMCTLWWAQYLIARTPNGADLNAALQVLEWVTDHALPSGVLAEQVNPHTGEPLSVSPLTWSHASFVLATLEYLEKHRSLQHSAKVLQPTAT